MTKIYKCLLIGLGQRSIDDHIPALVPNALGIELVAICDISSSKKKLLQKIFFNKKEKKPNFYTDLKKACDKEKPDFAIISTPHATHMGIAEELLKRKIPFLKEKPFAINLKAAYKLKDLIERDKGYMRMCTQRRYHPLYVYAKKALTHLGAIRHFEAQYQLHANAYHSGWRSTPKKSGGGCVIDLGYHYIDLLYWYFGMPAQIFSVIGPKSNKNLPYTVEETALISLKYNNGIIGHLFLSLCEPRKVERLLVYGEYGHIHLQREFLKRFDTNSDYRKFDSYSCLAICCL